ncbi:MAG: hypothetical protein R3C68_05995 [Myxococcota bacterium]
MNHPRFGAVPGNAGLSLACGVREPAVGSPRGSGHFLERHPGGNFFCVRSLREWWDVFGLEPCTHFTIGGEYLADFFFGLVVDFLDPWAAK